MSYREESPEMLSGMGEMDSTMEDQHFVDPVAFLLPGAFLALMTQPLICQIECCIGITFATPFTFSRSKCNCSVITSSSPGGIP